MLPGEAETAVQLHALLGGEHGYVGAQAGRDGDGHRGVRVLGGQAAGGVAGDGPRPGLGVRFAELREGDASLREFLGTTLSADSEVADVG